MQTLKILIIFEKALIMRKINPWKICIMWLFMCSLFSACGPKQPIDQVDDMNTVWDTRYENWISGEYETEATLSEEIYPAGVVRNKPIGDIAVNYSFYLSEEDFQSVTALLQQESIPVSNDVYKTAFTDWFSVSAVDGMCIKEYFFPVDFEVENDIGKYFVYKEIILEGTYANQKISFCGYVSDYLYETIYEIVESYLTDLP